MSNLLGRVKRLEAAQGMTGSQRYERMTWEELEAERQRVPHDPALERWRQAKLDAMSDLELHLFLYGPGVPLGLPHEREV